ncbi:hypothetical protein CHS0354_017299 [Potamilus streckersoni]|uniref:Solute carrier family 40 member n=1 Tax=Potamilus streckersoni TaxID=2493646 RepID=A0AAE0W803_9BIVA|nr:hypothetical protein CHS0354_017299 [Potamilus streckersoni]
MESKVEVLSTKIKAFVYISHTLSAWGDRMWAFGVGLFMVEIAPESLRLTAIYGFATGIAILFAGALLGDWIDKTPRLRAARTALIIQNMSVILCALVVYVIIWFKPLIQVQWPNESLLWLCYAGIILIAISANLASMASKIAVQKDWIVEICGRDKNRLADMSATLRMIDQTTLILAPIATGQIMTFGSLGIGALFIAGWNVFSVFIEYFLLWKVYKLVPALKSKKYKKKAEKEEEIIPGAEEIKAEDEKSPQEEDDKGNKSENVEETSLMTDEKPKSEEESKISVDAPNEKKPSKEPQGCSRFCHKMFSSFITLYRGWRTYMKYNVALAGLALACLYMTVLGFDNITVGYSYSQGINESIISILMASGALFGITGTFLFPRIRRKIGLERTGLFGLGAQIFSLCFCVASVFAPGSPFDPFYFQRPPKHVNVCNQTMPGSNVTNSVTLNVTSSSFYLLNQAGSSLPAGDMGVTSNNETEVQSSLLCLSEPRSYISISLLLGGIIAARCGLWMADLSISQLFLENVKETERGIVNGVQGSLNTLMDMLKYALVIGVPQPELFGFFIILSFLFICTGWCLYATFSRKRRGHLLPFHKMCDAENNNLANTHDVEIEVT